MPSGSPSTSGAPSESPQCDRDPERIAAKTRCLTDDLCPCGAHCELGQCVASCERNADCDDAERCDDFGRCVPEDQMGKVSPIDPAAGTRVTASPATLFVGGEAEEWNVRLQAPAAGGRARVAARGPYEVRCASSGSFERECIVSDVSAEGVTIAVRKAALPSDADAGSNVGIGDPTGEGVAVFDETGKMTLIAANEAAPEADVPHTGRYEGYITLSSPSPVLGPEEASATLGQFEFLRSVVSIDVYSDELIAIQDRDGLLLPEPLVLRSEAGAEDAFSATLPAYILYSRASSDDETAEVALPRIESAAGRLGDGALELRFDVELTGLAANGDGLPWQLVIGATRVAELAPNASLPSPTSDQDAKEDPARGQEPSSAFELARAAADEGTPATVPGDLVPFAFNGDLATAVACFASDAERAEAQAGRDAQLILSCLDAYTLAGLGFGIGGELSNGFASGAACEGAPATSVASIACEFTRVDQVPTQTDCQVCEDDCLATQRDYCSTDNRSQNCGSFESDICDPGCESQFFFDYWCDDPNNDLCSTACQNFCRDVEDGKPQLAEQCTAKCAALPCSNNPVYVPTPVTVGSCATIAQQYGCSVNEPAAANALLVTHNGQETTYHIAKECTFDAVIAPPEVACVGAAQCVDAAHFAEPAGYQALLSPESGDVACEGSVDPLFPILESPIDEYADALEACRADAERSALGANSLDELFGSSGCFDRGRFHLTTDRAFAATRAGSGDEAAEALGHRAIQGFVQAHALIATLAYNLYQETLVLGKVADPTADAVDALTASMQVWPVVLQPRIASALLELSPAVAAEPDARPRLGIDAEDAVAVSRVGLAVDFLDALSSQLQLMDTLLDRAWLEGNASRLAARRATASELLRVSVPVGALVASLTGSVNDETTTWGTAWARASAQYRTRVESVLQRLSVIASGKNPIGIEDADLPLYYQGDPLSANERFAAVSRSLIGTGTGALAIAPKAITDAQAALEDVGDAWQERADNHRISEQRIQDIKYRYGELITGYCGASIQNDTNYAGPGQAPCLNPGSQSVFDCPEINTEYCFVEEACRPRAESFKEELSTGSLGAQLCVLSELRRRYGASLLGAPANLDNVLRDIGSAFSTASGLGQAFPMTVTALEQRSKNQRVAVIRVGNKNYDVPLNAIGALDVQLPASVMAPGRDTETSSAASAYKTIVDKCEVSRQVTEAQRPSARPASCERADQCPSGEACRVGHCETLAASDPLDKVDCYYDGAISEQAIAVRAAADDIAIAKREFDELIESYDIARRSCIELQTGNTLQEEALANHNKTMQGLDIARATLAGVAALAAGVKDCASSVDVEKGLSGATVTACVAAGVEATANAAIAGIEGKMNDAERKHEEAALGIDNDTAEAICFNDAELNLVGSRAALMRIKRALQDQAIAMINLRGQKSYTLGLFNEGNEAVALEEARLTRSLASRFILSESAIRFARRMDYARRVTYLAVRAVEYEFQASLAERQAVLAARRPDELEAVVEKLSAYVNAGKVNGSAPDALHAVISLRDHLLQLGDLSGNPAGAHALTPTERLRLYLTAPQHAEYDAEGNYLGQRIPFSIAPLAALGFGQTQGVPIVADNDCGERLWSVNAAVLGSEVFDGNESSFTRLDLLKKNTFYSQWCEDNADEDFQVASVRPAVNLFLDPSDPNRQQPSAQDASDSTRGRMQPYLNVTRAEFEKEDYAQGSTTELAGRGLYGDYALFIPKSVLSIDGSAGLRLELVDDILLRLDYVSVAH